MYSLRDFSSAANYFSLNLVNHFENIGNVNINDINNWIEGSFFRNFSGTNIEDLK